MLALSSLGVELPIGDETRNGAGFKSGEDVVVGIRPEFVALHRNGRGCSPGDLRLSGKGAEVSSTTHGAMVSLRPEGRDALVKVAVRAEETTNLGQAEVEIVMPSRHLFCVPVSDGALGP